MKTKALAKRENKLFKELEKEYNKEMTTRIKSVALQKFKEIKMAEITLKKLKKELKDILTGKKEYSEEELLFNDENDY